MSSDNPSRLTPLTLSFGGVEAPLNSLPERLRRQLTIRTLVRANIWARLSVLTTTNNALYVPRDWAYNTVSEARIATRFPDSLRFEGPCNITPLDNQRAVIAYVLSRFNSARSYAVLELKAGIGKTFIGLVVAANLGVKTLIVVHNHTLLAQWNAHIKSGFPTLTVGELSGERRTDGDIVIGIINTVAALDPEYFAKARFGFTIYDEIHMYASPKHSRAFFTAAARYVLGLTATANQRPDKFDRAYELHFGAVVRASDIPGFTADPNRFKGNVQFVYYYGHPDYTRIIRLEPTAKSEQGGISVPLMINRLVEDPYRNALITQYTRQLYERGLHVFVFSDRREHLRHLQTLLRAAGVNVAIENETDTHIRVESTGLKAIDDATLLIGGSSDETIREARDRARVVLTTYAYAGTGLSIDKMTALVLATPRRNGFEQITGRIFRRGSDTSIQREIVDIVDASTVLKFQCKTRAEIYTANGFTTEQHRHKWGDFETDAQSDKSESLVADMAASFGEII